MMTGRTDTNMLSLSFFYNQVKYLETRLRTRQDFDCAMIESARLDLAVAYYKRAWRAWQVSQPRYLWVKP